MESFVNTMLVSYFGVLKKFSVFTGRAGRREFWMFVLANLAVGVVLIIFGRIPFLGIIFTIVAVLYSLAVLVPGIAVGIRRLHDTNRSGFFLLLALIPAVGAIVVLVLCAMEGTPGENQYGPDPKNAIEA
jgi:uncharacterized membrane protein YhaH (DUF805 family)